MDKKDQFKVDDKLDIEDLEDFISGLRSAFDSLEESTPDDAQGIQLQLAKAISLLRHKKIAKIEQLPKFDLESQYDKDDLRNFLLNKLELLKIHLDSEDIPMSRKFDLVMEITKLRTKISELLSTE